MKKRVVLFAPLAVAIGVLDIIAVSTAAWQKNTTLTITVLLMMAVSAFAFYKIFTVNRTMNRFYRNINSFLTPYQKDAMLSFPMAVVVSNQRGEILWYNDLMKEKVFAGEDSFGYNMNDLFPKLKMGQPCPVQGYGVDYKGKLFTAYPSRAGHEAEELNVTYFIDDDKLKRIAREYFSSRPAVAWFMIDNYDELLQNAKENERSQVMAEVEYVIETFVSNNHGLVRKIEKDKFLVILEERYLRGIIENRFNVLDDVRRIEAGEKMPVTLSIGVGREARTISEAEEMASQALDMALGRGGDQAAIKTKNGYEFYGGVSKGIEKRTKVKTRIVATALMELIQSSSNVLLMGHRFGDLDCVGAAAGLYYPIHEMGKPVNIVFNSKTNLVKQLHQRLIENGYEDAFVEPDEALSLVGEDTLLIIVDTHTPHMVEAPDVYKACKNVVVIDHHRKMVDYIDNAVIFHHEPFASSAAEMVAELLQYIDDKYKINGVAADALLSGIMLDTKNFILKTGVRTFEAAAYLKRMGADTVEVKGMFASSMAAYQERCKVVAAAKVSNHCAIAAVTEPIAEIKIVAAQAADELLNINDVYGSFVLYKESEDVVALSARSMGKMNVQVIMEKLGGGGHLTMAGAQIKGVTMEEALQRLKDAIEEYMASLNPEPQALEEPQEKEEHAENAPQV